MISKPPIEKLDRHCLGDNLMPMPDDILQCPKCHQPLNGLDYQGVHIETCPACGGDWLDAGELGAIVHARKMQFNEQECLAMAQAAKITGVKLTTLNRQITCPRCGSATHPVNYGEDSGIIIDKCARCGGVWLDKGEIEKIQELVEGWHDELPDDLAHYGPKMRAVQTQVNQEMEVPITHRRMIDWMINGVLNFIGD
jgi:hypothetical protein